jgi:hypothetical protein
MIVYTGQVNINISMSAAAMAFSRAPIGNLNLRLNLMVFAVAYFHPTLTVGGGIQMVLKPQVIHQGLVTI